MRPANDIIFDNTHLLGGAIRAFMMGIHAYFNIWCEARAGWGVFMKRRTAVHKISSLPEASYQQLQQFDDVCAICYQVCDIHIDQMCYKLKFSTFGNFLKIFFLFIIYFFLSQTGNDIS